MIEKLTTLEKIEKTIESLSALAAKKDLDCSIVDFLMEHLTEKSDELAEQYDDNTNDNTIDDTEYEER